MDVEGTRTFQATADAYDRFMGRYSRELAGPFGALCLPPQGGVSWTSGVVRGR